LVETLYRETNEGYTIVVNKLAEESFDVLFLPHHAHHAIEIENVHSKRHAIEGAKNFPTFYAIAIEHGFSLTTQYFKHRDGREVHTSFAMDLDCTKERFTNLLLGNVV